MTPQPISTSCFVALSKGLHFYLHTILSGHRVISETFLDRPCSRSRRPTKYRYRLLNRSNRGQLPDHTVKATVEWSSSDVLQELNDWLPTADIFLHCAEIRSDENGLRGLYATRDIAPGDTILTIPHNSALVASRHPDSVPDFMVFHGLDTSFWKGAPWHIRLAITLLDHTLSPRPTFFDAYTSALPANPNTALNAIHSLGLDKVDSQLGEFQITDLARQFYQQTVAEFHAIRSALFPASAVLFSLNDYIWAVSIVFSRAFGCPTPKNSANSSPPDFWQVNSTVFDRASFDVRIPPGDFALFPGLDMANHSIHAGTTLRTSDLSPHLAYDLVAGRAVEKGQQVFVSYGSKGNEELIVCYGFVEADSPEEKVKERNLATWILTHARDNSSGMEDLSKRRVAQLERMRLFDSPVEISYNLHALDPKLMSLLRVAVADEDELSLLDAERDNDATPTKSDVPLSLRNEVAAWRAIENRCAELLKEIGIFSETELDHVQRIRLQGSVSWTWGTTKGTSDGELLFRWDRARVLQSTLERTCHFIKVSLAVGRVCTVLLPPTQSVLKADAFDSNVIMGMPDMRSFKLIHRDVETNLDIEQKSKEK